MHKSVHLIIWSIFIIYCLISIYLLFFWFRINYDMTYSAYIHEFVNIIPFRTIMNYINMPIQEDFHYYLILLNIGGNILISVPFGFLLPCLFKRMRSFISSITIAIITVVIIELLQLLFMVGSCDVDDLFLNVIGAIIGFGIWKLRYVQKTLKSLNIIN